MSELHNPVPGALRRTDLMLKARRDEGAFRLERDLFLMCPKCRRRDTQAVWSKLFYVCPDCGAYLPIGGYYRLNMILDEGSFQEFPQSDSRNLLAFPGYEEKLSDNRHKTGLRDAVVSGIGAIGGNQTVICVLDSRFMMGSMGTSVGESVTFAAETAHRLSLPLIIFSASGGARMQEGIFSLMQMAKTSAAIAAFSDAGGLFISCLTHPTTGGVTASFASLGDITLAEPDALIGFAGPRVIEQTIGQKLPAGFQRSESQRRNGFVDKIVPRNELRETLSRLLRLHRNGARAS